MSGIDQVEDGAVDYHARQRANAAENEAGMAGHQVSEARGAVQEARKRLEKALALLDQDADPALREEVTAALRELTKLHL